MVSNIKYQTIKAYEAIESALKAVNLNPNHVLYRAKLAEAYLVLGKYEEAKTHWEGSTI
ncbi:tetratricopeptide repeat protein [Candidatus Megaera venefica]|uniref:tetratricopeptide repeat protein n=1 Tax=Candidatus Megaera venefica TaxID=2055910 RepID=UPI002AD2375D|nr:tetratricopeptide repeat protein [Candidatus Megaera venefica]